MRDDVVAVGQFAAQQYGIVTRAQALGVGMSPDMIRYRLRSGVWQAVDYGVYRFSATPTSWHQRVAAACLAGPAVASHRSAGLLWHYPGMPAELVEVTALRHRRRKAGDVVWHESYLLMPDQLTELEGIQVTSALRTFVDLAGVLERDQLEVVRDDGIRRRLFTAASGFALLERLGHRRPGFRMVRSLLETAMTGDAVPQSVLETQFLLLVRRAGLPTPRTQFAISDGKRTIHVDFAYPEQRLAIELDGDAYHWGERADRTDRARDRFLASLQWRAQRFTSEDIRRRSAEIASDVAQALNLGASLRGSISP
jgi:very-short-patch-repair endonuclease